MGRKRPLLGAGGDVICGPRVRGRLRMIFRKSRDFSANLRNSHMAPARWVCSTYSDFSGYVGTRRKRGAYWAQACEICDPLIRSRLRRISSGSWDFPETQKRPMSTERWVCAIYSGFSGSVGIRRKRGLPGAAGRNMRPQGSVSDCVWPSGDFEISRRISENDPCLPRGGFAPFTRISRDLSEF